MRDRSEDSAGDVMVGDEVGVVKVSRPSSGFPDVNVDSDCSVSLALLLPIAVEVGSVVGAITARVASSSAGTLVETTCLLGVGTKVLD